MADVPISKLVVPGSNDTLHFRDDSAANKVSSSTNGNLAGLDANGNLTDSGVSASSIGNLSGSHTGICETAASTSAKIVTIGDGTWIPKEGDIIGVKFTYSNTALFVTLNVNGIGNKGIWYGDSVDPSGADYICGKAGSYIFYMYDGTYWIWLNEGKHDGNNFPSVAVYTDSNQQVKIGTCNYYTLTNKSYCHFIFRYPNSYKGELFIKINNSSSKTIYINGEISSSTNYTLPAGTYIAYYENDKWYFRTDGKLTANITGTAASDSTKADKVANATNGNLAGLNASGNLTDSGWDGAKATTSASGNPISITGLKSNQLAVNPVITFEPIQTGSGDPSPVNERPISGYDKIEVLSCGKNIWNDDVVSGQSQMSQNGRTYTNTITDSRNYVNLRAVLLNGSTFVRKASINTNITTAGRYSGVIGVASGEKVTTIVLGHTGASKDIGVAYTLQAPITKVCTLAVSVDVTSANPSTAGGFVMKDIQLEENTSATTYTPINKTTDLSEPLPQTVYGGQEVVRTGKMTVTKKKIRVTWGDGSGAVNLGSYTRKGFTVSDASMVEADRTQAICDKAPYYGNYSSNSLHFYISTDGNLYIFLPNDTDASTTIDICYIFATPIEIQLTPHEISLLKDYAYVSTNGTSMSFDYHNGEMASLGDVAQLSESVENLKDYLGANNSKTGISVSEYISTNPFICPYDGYVVVGSGSATSGTLRLQIAGANGISCAFVYMLIAGANQVQSVFVKKGLRVFREQIVTGAWMSYIPIVP